METALDKYIKTHLQKCDSCGYEKGFHLTFYRVDPHKVKILPLCPECGKKIDIKWIIDLT